MKKFLSRTLRFFLNDWIAWLLLVLAGGAAWALFSFLNPRVFVIAAGQADPDELKVVQLLVETLAKERSAVRLVPLWTTGVAESAAMLTNGKADLAVIRSDLNVGRGASSLVAMRKFYPVVFTKKSSKISKVSELRGNALVSVGRVN